MKRSRHHRWLLLASWVLAFTASGPATAQAPTRKSPSQTIAPAVADRLRPLDSVRLTGYVGEKLDASYEHRILAQDALRLEEPFRHRTETACWQSEFWGKWFTSAVLAYRYRPEPRLKRLLDNSVTRLMSTQTPDGYIGNYTDSARLQHWDIWGMKYCMLGLIAWHDLTGDTKSLRAASRLADDLIAELAAQKKLLVRLGAHRGMAASSVLGPITLLYTRTRDPRYLAFAREIVRQWETPDGPQLISRSSIDVGKRFPKPKQWFGWEQGQKAYEMMSCYEGLLELYRITGDPSYKTAVEATWQNIETNEINITGSGSSVECWFDGAAKQALPIIRYQETCVTATWIKLSQQLLRLTGDPKYADAIEKAYYNALLGSMTEDGATWSKYTPLEGRRLLGEEQCGMGINCCIASGPRGLFTLPLTAVMQSNAGLQVNFFLPGTYRSHTPSGHEITLSQTTDYPASGNILIRLDLPRQEEFEIAIRIPAWSRQSQLTIDDQPVTGLIPGTVVRLNRKWKRGDVIRLVTDMRGRIVTLGNIPSFKAIMTGPVVLARDQRLGGPNVDDIITPIADTAGYFPLEPVAAADPRKDMWLLVKGEFLVESTNTGQQIKTPLLLCDYASAGKTYDDRSWFRVWFEQYLNPSR